MSRFIDYVATTLVCRPAAKSSRFSTRVPPRIDGPLLNSRNSCAAADFQTPDDALSSTTYQTDAPFTLPVHFCQNY
jgi:hypothetical protein